MNRVPARKDASMKQILYLWAALTALACMAIFLPGSIVKASYTQQDPRYLSPSELAFSPDGKTLYALCEEANLVMAMDLTGAQPRRTVAVGGLPRGIAVAPDGRRLYVTNSWDDTVSTIDAAEMKQVATMHTGMEPYGIVIDHAGKTLYVANRISDDVSVLDAASGRQVARIPAGHGASYLALSPDGQQVYCTHVYPEIGKDRTPSELSMPWIGSIHVKVAPEEDRRAPQSQITVIDTKTNRAVTTIAQNNVAGVFHLALSQDHRLGVAAEMRPKNLVPLAHVEHGWAFGYSLLLFGKDVGQPVHVPLDTMERYDSYPYAVAITPDKARIFVTATGSDWVTVLDAAKLLRYVHTARRPFDNNLLASSHYVIARIRVGKNPRGAVLSADGKKLYVADRLDDAISVIDTASNQVVQTIALNAEAKLTPLRRGEQLFYSSAMAYHGQFGCANCHIDGTMDGLNWDLEPDGFGKNIVQNRLLEALPGTGPFKWVGSNPNIPTECGIRTALYFYRSEGYDTRALADLVAYIRHLPSRPNRFRSADGTLTASQLRGKALFYRTENKAGQAIPEENQCAFCHSGPKYTNHRSFDVGSGKPTDTTHRFDTAHLTNVALMAPYMHDGSSRTLEEIWTLYNMDNRHGQTSDLTKDELHDLVEYLKTL
jgi:YVTN family beta-propeller protein